MVYEYAITFHQEMATVWRRPLNLTSLLLLSTRYTLIMAQLITWFPLSVTVGNSHLHHDSSVYLAISEVGQPSRSPYAIIPSNVYFLSQSCRLLGMILVLANIIGYAQATRMLSGRLKCFN